MYNITTIYRFNTPFLDIEKEKKGLIGVIEKIKSSLSFDAILFTEEKELIGDFYKISLEFQDDLGKIDFFYANDISEYYLPIFKLNLSLNPIFLRQDKLREKAVKFLNNIFECFDGLNEKEYLIDLDNSLYYSGFLGFKKYPHHDFSALEKIQNDFEGNNGIKLIENFIVNFKDSSFVLTRDNAKEYHKLHGVLLYFIYLVFLIFRNLEKSKKAKEALKQIESGIYDGQAELMKQRLDYVDDLNMINFKKYKEKLELFFKLF